MSPDFDEEKIHKVRTTIKKMRAIGDWSGVPVRKFFKQNYKVLGEIRDIQLVLSKINKGEYTGSESFCNWLESSLHHHKVEWQKNYDLEKIKNQLDELEERSVKSNNHRNKNALKFEGDKNQKLGAFLKERPLTDDQIHNGRKTIKEIDYLNKWEKKDLDGHMKMVSEETGNFMDRISAMKLLDKYMEEETDETKINEAESILGQWRSQKEEEKKKLMKIIDSIPFN